MSSRPNMVHNVPPVKLLPSRADFVVSRCMAKNVLHLGCAESGTTVQSLNKGSLLHLRIAKVAKRVIGVDIDGEALELLERHGVPDLVKWDVEQLGDISLEIPIDVIVAGEILEHLANPGLCLQGIHNLMEKHKCTLIITVPNAFSLRHFLPMVLRRRELVLPDHTAYYSFTTLSALLERCDLKPCELYTYSNLVEGPTSATRLMKQVFNITLLRVMPHLAEGIIAVIEKD